MDARTAKRIFRIQQWTAIFQDRLNSGLKINDYCNKIGITRDQYFYWQKIVREDALSRAKGPGFVEICLPDERAYVAAEAHTSVAQTEIKGTSDTSLSEGLLISINGIDIHVTEYTSPILLAKTIGVIRDVK